MCFVTRSFSVGDYRISHRDAGKCFYFGLTLTVYIRRPEQLYYNDLIEREWVGIVMIAIVISCMAILQWICFCYKEL